MAGFTQPQATWEAGDDPVENDFGEAPDLYRGDGEGLSEASLEEARLAEAHLRMNNFSVAEVIAAGHEALLRDLVARVRAGVASHQEKAILRNALRDNGMTLAPQLPPGSAPEAGSVPLPELDPYRG